MAQGHSPEMGGHLPKGWEEPGSGGLPCRGPATCPSTAPTQPLDLEAGAGCVPGPGLDAERTGAGPCPQQHFTYRLVRRRNMALGPGGHQLLHPTHVPNQTPGRPWAPGAWEREEDSDQHCRWGPLPTPRPDPRPLPVPRYPLHPELPPTKPHRPPPAPSRGGGRAEGSARSWRRKN